MCKVLKFTLIVVFYSIITNVSAQNKYALLVAVNNYYEKPGVRSSRSLRGCVNDAISVKSLLVNRFGFNPSNVSTLYDKEAIRNNVMGEMAGIFRKCKPGDAVVFYFSGHGIWMNNLGNTNDPVKDGLSQAIVMNDLYAPRWGFLIRDAILKKIFNQFVDNNIKVTAVFDCCYSGNLAMIPFLSEETEPYTPEAEESEKSLNIDAIRYNPEVLTPKGCSLDSSSAVEEVPDIDVDGVPDCADYEVNTHPACFPVDTRGIGDCKLSDFFYIDTPLDSFHLAINKAEADGADTTSKFHALKDILTITDREVITRPSEKQGSGFLSMSAASDKQKALDITDETGIKHGAFTKALLTIYKNNSAELSVDKLLKKLTAQLKKQNYNQTPTFHLDSSSRYKGNMLGIPPREFNNSITAKCTGINGGIITIDKGSNDGIAKGNILTNVSISGNITIQVSGVSAENATGTISNKKALLIKQGHLFKVTDNYTISNPLVKVYIPRSNLSLTSFNSFFKKNIHQWIKHENYRDYNNYSNLWITSNIFYKDANSIDTNLANASIPFYVFLPIPAQIADLYKETLGKDQNVEITNAPDKADYILYMNYSKESKKQKEGFILTFHPPINADFNPELHETFYSNNVQLPGQSLNSQSLIRLSDRIKKQSREVLRGHVKNWLNEYEKRPAQIRL